MNEPVPEKRNETMRLQQFLAAAGIGSRRSCEELITEGRIQVDDIPVKNLGIKVNPKKQKIEMDGIRIKIQAKKYFLVNKPRGVLCTSKDPQGRPRVIDLFPKDAPRLFTVGRLDDQSEGLILVTNDGDWANQIAHPRFRLYRTYRVQVAGKPTVDTLNQLKNGFYFKEGKFSVHKIRRTGKQGRSTFLEVVLTEGQNREVRRLLARVGHKVMALQRVGFGPIKLGSLAIGKYRPLRQDELLQLQEVIERNVRESRKTMVSKTVYRPRAIPKGTTTSQSKKRSPKRKTTKPQNRPFNKTRGNTTHSGRARVSGKPKRSSQKRK